MQKRYVRGFMEKNTGFENKKKKFISLVIGLIISVAVICFIFYKLHRNSENKWKKFK